MNDHALVDALAQYRAGLDAEIALLEQLALVAARQRGVTVRRDFEQLGIEGDERDRLTRALVAVEEGLQPVRARLSAARDRVTTLSVNNVDVTSEFTNGKIGGLSYARDTLIPGYQSRLDDIAHGVAQHEAEAHPLRERRPRVGVADARQHRVDRRRRGRRAALGGDGRCGADHLDVALHEPGAPRRAENVTGYRIVPFAGVLAVRLASASDLA